MEEDQGFAFNLRIDTTIHSMQKGLNIVNGQKVYVK